jgi:hypothetical protein
LVGEWDRERAAPSVEVPLLHQGTNRGSRTIPELRVHIRWLESARQRGSRSPASIRVLEARELPYLASAEAYPGMKPCNCPAAPITGENTP